MTTPGSTLVVKPISVRRLVQMVGERLELEILGDEGALDREVAAAEVSSPGLALAGYTKRFPAERLLVFGETEITYLAELAEDERVRILRQLFAFRMPCIFVTKAQQLPAGMVETAKEANVVILRSPFKTAEFYRRIKPLLESAFAPTATLHGSLADVYGVGLLFIGKSGIGKSECVLDLVERGHRLVADDLVIASRRGNDILIGRGHELQRHYMEIRGVGLIDIPLVFGIRSVRQQKRIEVVVRLEEWDHNQAVERTGLDTEHTEILGVQVPQITIPLNPGKNITVVAEVIAMNHLLLYTGINPAQRFNERLLRRMRDAADVERYLAEDDE